MDYHTSVKQLGHGANYRKEPRHTPDFWEVAQGGLRGCGLSLECDDLEFQDGSGVETILVPETLWSDLPAVHVGAEWEPVEWKTQPRIFSRSSDPALDAIASEHNAPPPMALRWDTAFLDTEARAEFEKMKSTWAKARMGDERVAEEQVVWQSRLNNLSQARHFEQAWNEDVCASEAASSSAPPARAVPSPSKSQCSSLRRSPAAVSSSQCSVPQRSPAARGPRRSPASKGADDCLPDNDLSPYEARRKTAEVSEAVSAMIEVLMQAEAEEAEPVTSTSSAPPAALGPPVTDGSGRGSTPDRLVSATSSPVASKAEAGSGRSARPPCTEQDSTNASDAGGPTSDAGRNDGECSSCASVSSPREAARLAEIALQNEVAWDMLAERSCVGHETVLHEHEV